MATTLFRTGAALVVPADSDFATGAALTVRRPRPHQADQEGQLP